MYCPIQNKGEAYGYYWSNERVVMVERLFLRAKFELAGWICGVLWQLECYEP